MVNVTTNEELSQALDNLESVIEIQGNLTFDRDVSLITHPLKLVVPAGSQINNVSGDLYCRTDIGLSASMLNGYQEPVGE